MASLKGEIKNLENIIDEFAKINDSGIKPLLLLAQMVVYI